MKAHKATAEYMQYAPIRQHIRYEHLEREVMLAESIAGFIADVVKKLRAPEQEVALPTTRLAH